MKCALVSYWHDIEALVSALTQYDKVYACELAAYNLLNMGVQVDTVLSDFDSVQFAAFEQFNTELIVLPTVKDETDTRALLQHIMATEPEAEVTLYNDFTGRLDHGLALLSLFNVHKRLMVKTATTMMYRLEAGNHVIKQVKGYDYISFLALNGVRDLQISDLKYELNATDVLPFIDLTISNEFIGTNEAQVSFTMGQLLVLYTRDG